MSQNIPYIKCDYSLQRSCKYEKRIKLKGINLKILLLIESRVRSDITISNKMGEKNQIHELILYYIQPKIFFVVSSA